MSESSKKEESNASSQSQGNLAASIQKVQEQLASLERKIDSLIKQSQPRSFDKERSFSKPYSKPFSKPFAKPFKKPYGESSGFGGKDRHDDGARGKKSFKKKSDSDSRGEGSKKKPFYKNRHER